jgi:phosphoglycolate phosphatase
MSTFPFRIVGFDLDGTLVDSATDIAPAVNLALRAVGRDEVSLDVTRGLIGGGTRLALERALEVTGGPLDADQFEHVHTLLLDHYTANITTNTRPYPGCIAALDALADHGCQLAVVTNKAEYLARKLLDELDMTARFASIVGGDTLGRARAKPAPDLIVETIARLGGGPFAMVGDSSYDVRAARGAGVPVAAFSFGYHDMPPQDLGADVLLDHFDELVRALERLG